MWRYGVFLQKKHERGYGKGEKEGRGWVGYDEGGIKRGGGGFDFKCRAHL